MAVDILQTCEPEDPRRCQAVTGKGQCKFLSLEGNTVCRIHVSSHARAENKKHAEVYQLTKWRDRLSRLTDESGIKSLRDEIGILRMTLESVVQKCQTDEDLIINATQIGDLVSRVEKLVISCARLEKQTGMMLDKTTALQIAGNIVSIIGEHVTDPIIIDNISDAIIEKVLNVEYVEE